MVMFGIKHKHKWLSPVVDEVQFKLAENAYVVDGTNRHHVDVFRLSYCHDYVRVGVTILPPKYSTSQLDMED